MVVLTEPTREEIMREIQTRIWASLKSGYKYTGTADDSEEYLRPLVGKRLDLTIMYVDLVGSTSMSLEISQTKFITIISSFVHEMAHAVKRHNGYVLKFVGDAVLAYFPNEDDAIKGTKDSLECAFSMIDVIKNGMNPILNQYDYPDLKIKIGIDSGQIMAISYGIESDDFPTRSYLTSSLLRGKIAPGSKFFTTHLLSKQPLYFLRHEPFHVQMNLL